MATNPGDLVTNLPQRLGELAVLVLELVAQGRQRAAGVPDQHGRLASDLGETLRAEDDEDHEDDRHDLRQGEAGHDQPMLGGCHR